MVDATVQQPPMQPTLVVEPDLAAAQRFGVKPGDIRRAATELLSGIVVGSLYQDQKIFDVVVRGTPDTQKQLLQRAGPADRHPVRRPHPAG